MQENSEETTTSVAEERAWKALTTAYEKTSKIKQDEETRLFQLVAGYLGGVVLVLVSQIKTGTTIPLIFFSLASVANTFYVIYYSYCSFHLTQSSVYLDWLAKEAETFIGNYADYLRWESFSARGGKGQLRRYINVAMSAWRFVPLTLAIILPFYSISSSDQSNDMMNRIQAIAALIFALLFGSLSCLASMWYVFKATNEISEHAPTIPTDRQRMESKEQIEGELKSNDQSIRLGQPISREDGTSGSE